MTEKGREASALRNSFLREISHYETVFGDLNITGSDAMAMAAMSMCERIHRVIDDIQSVYSAYDGFEDFVHDYPHLRPVVEGFAKIDVDDNGKFDIKDLRALAGEISMIERPSSTQKKLDNNPGGNPFTIK